MDTVDFPVSVILPASGCGERFGGATPKQYSLILNRPLIVYTLQAFHRISWIKHIVITVSEEYLDYVSALLDEYGLSKVTVTLGSTARHRSIYNGVKHLSTLIDSSNVVIIHDAVRMFIEEDVIKRVAVAASMHGAAGVIRPLVSTVVAADSDGFLEESLDRNKYRASEMPQGFIMSVIKNAYEKATDYDFDYGTECLHLAMKYSGTTAKLIDGPSSLWKVTHKKDLYAAEGILKESELVVHISGCKDEELYKVLQQKIEGRNMKVQTADKIDCTDNSGRCTVYCHNGISVNTIQAETSKLLTQQNSCKASMDSIIIHVIKTETVSAGYSQLVTALKQEVTHWKNNGVLVYIILYHKSATFIDIADMVSSALWMRDPVMSGQIFTVT